MTISIKYLNSIAPHGAIEDSLAATVADLFPGVYEQYINFKDGCITIKTPRLARGTCGQVFFLAPYDENSAALAKAFAALDRLNPDFLQDGKTMFFKFSDNSILRLIF